MPILSQISPVYASSSYFLQINYNTVLHLRLIIPSDLFPSRLFTRTLYAPFLSLKLATWPANFILLDFITRTIFGEEYKS
jgi:hypothetical protein